MTVKTIKRFPLIFLSGLLLLSTSCGGASDPSTSYPAPDSESLAPFGQWAESAPLTFRLIKITAVDSIPFDEVFEYATKGNHFVVARLQVMPGRKGKGTVDYAVQVRLLDAQGKAYIPDPYRFSVTNNAQSSVIMIKSGKFVEYNVAFLVPRSFKPVALRCEGTMGADPVFLALVRK